MKRFVYKAILAVILVSGIVGCASTPQISKGSSAYLQKGMVSARFRGNDFYMVIGEVDLYHYNLFGNLKPTGQTVEIAAAVQADKDTGEILRIATMQGKDSEGLTVVDGGSYALADLRGGMSVIDAQPYPRWLDAIQAMRNAIRDLDTYTQFTGDDQSGPVVVAVAPGWWWWGWGGYGRRRYHWR